MVEAIKRHDWAASLGEVARVASMVLVEKMLELTSHVVAPAPSSNVQIAFAYSYERSFGGGDACTGLAAGGGARLTVGVISFAGGTNSATGLPSSVCPLIAPTGHEDDNCCVMTTPLGIVHLTWAVASLVVASAATTRNFRSTEIIPHVSFFQFR